MPKYRKGRKKTQEKYRKELKELKERKNDMFTSTMISIGIGIGCFILSLLFNGNIIPVETTAGSALDVVMIIVRSLMIILFFTFTFLGLANSLELRGSPASIREIIIVAIIALIQSVRSGAVFGLSLVGILLVILYLWSMQPKVESA